MQNTTAGASVFPSNLCHINSQLIFTMVKSNENLNLQTNILLLILALYLICKSLHITLKQTRINRVEF